MSLLLFFCSLCRSPCSPVVLSSSLCACGRFFFSQLILSSATSHIRRKLAVSRLNWSARLDQLFTNRQTLRIATPGCHVAWRHVMECITNAFYHGSSVFLLLIEDHTKLPQQSHTRTSMHSHLCLQTRRHLDSVACIACTLISVAKYQSTPTS